ncbi:hypothetical protein P3X46_017235 [Hevea brasiliensis]|uniref:RNase H type-1 domain-containing protein n=1 Tax=Hevea brasiliensis TaxID=3981 RepID=A0ABQ9M3S9_HEVBR|nr:hypothetical protein P3X46_017235 [Hevea brasiliensis]
MRGIPVDPSCPVCKFEAETVKHMLFWCSHAKAAWFASSCNYNSNLIGFSSFAQWWMSIVQHFQGEQESINTIATACWIIWKERNKVTFNNSNPNPYFVAQKINRSITEAQMLEENKPPNQRPDYGQNLVSNDWFPPPVGYLKFNSDVVWKHQDFKAVVVVVVRNHYGQLIDGFVKFVEALFPLVGEALAMQEAIQMAITMGVPKMVLETDSSILHPALSSEQQVSM